MKGRILICTDLDRTLLPNGSAPESPMARPLFSALVSRPEVLLAYVSGRHKELVEDAISEYELPRPDFVIGDVGTSLYEVGSAGWKQSEAWVAEIAPDWVGYDHAQMQQLFASEPALVLQEAGKQSRFKLSYYLSMDVDTGQLMAHMRKMLNERNVRAELIYSVDEAEQVGLLDVLPASATKFHAVEFLMNSLGFGLGNVVFAGDSGNDLPVLASPIHAVLVANASVEVKDQAEKLIHVLGTEDAFYVAKGDFMAMNGNYAAGILEGVAHYLPYTKLWMTSDE